MIDKELGSVHDPCALNRVFAIQVGLSNKQKWVNKSADFALTGSLCPSGVFEWRLLLLSFQNVRNFSHIKSGVSPYLMRMTDSKIGVSDDICEDIGTVLY